MAIMPRSYYMTVDRQLTRSPLASFGYARRPASTPAGWSPGLDIAEDSGRFVLYADLPGLAQEAINPAYTNGVLVITLPKGEPEDLS